jgi:hypothetical protein
MRWALIDKRFTSECRASSHQISVTAWTVMLLSKLPRIP